MKFSDFFKRSILPTNSNYDLTTILEVGDWLRKSTFSRFYHKTFSSFQEAVLRLEDNDSDISE